MIKFKDLSKEKPYQIFKNYYDLMCQKGCDDMDACLIASFDKEQQEPNARYVNLKYINHNEWIFFSNYNSTKAKEFILTNKISAVFYWKSINVQVRIKAKITKASKEISDIHFLNRSKEKNAIAISSEQSKKIKSYKEVLNNYSRALIESDLNIRPEHWGGFSFIPYVFEFWTGEKFRINERQVFEFDSNKWDEFFLQP